MTPNYGNLGDQAITQATIEFVKNELPKYKLITVSLNEIYLYLREIQDICTSEDIIFLQGGGNMGSLYHKYNPQKFPQIMIMYDYIIQKLKALNMPEEAFTRVNSMFMGNIRTCMKLEAFYVQENGRKKR